MTPFERLCEKLEKKIIDSYETGVSLEDAERLAAEFLAAQIAVSDQLKVADLDSRMKKSGVKALRAAIYLKEATKGEKKPSDVLLQATVDQDDLVQGEQQTFDEAEARCAALERYYSIFREAHIFYRGVSKGRFDG